MTFRGTALFILAGAAILAAGTLPARATDVCGAVCDETWTLAGSPYVATCDVTVADGCVLSIDGGVEVRFDAGTGLVVTGALDVMGTTTDPVILLPNQGDPMTGDWRGLEFFGASSGNLDFAEISYATYGIHVDDEASIDLYEVDASRNTTGLYVRGTGPPSVQVAESSFQLNTDYGVHVIADALGLDVNITRSNISNNFGDVFGNQVRVEANPPLDASDETIHARENWWGSSDSSAIAGRLWDLADQHSDFPRIDWCAYLTEADGAPRDVHCPPLRVASGETLVMDLTDSPWLLTSWVDVEPGATLQVGAGVQILSPANEDGTPMIRAFGTTEIRGTPSAPAVFTTEGAAAVLPWWGGFRVYGDQAMATIENAVFEHGYAGLLAEDGSTVVVDGAAFTNNHLGMKIGLGSSVTATGCTITDNANDGVWIWGGPTTALDLSNSEIHSNGAEAYEILSAYSSSGSSVVINARQNWWGTTDTSAIAARIWDHADDPETARVDWCEWLDAPGGAWVPMHCPGTLVCDKTVSWDQTDKPYVLLSDVTVCPTGTLTVEAGVEVLAPINDPALVLIVEGTLDVNGTEPSPVTFGSFKISPTAGDWQGLRLTSGGTSTIDHAVVSHAARGVHVFDGASAVLNGVTLTGNTDGLYVYGTLTPSLTAADSAFVGNEQYGIYVQGVSSVADPAISITGSEIHSNLGSHDFYLGGGFRTPASTIFHAHGNWWGTANAALIAARIRDRADSTTNAFVDWCPQLTSAGGSPAAYNCLDLEICAETEVLSQTDEPYLMISDLTICPTGTLVVGQGVELRVVEADPQLTFVVEGILDVNGTVASPVLFTSHADTPQATDWSGLRFIGVLPSELEYATIEYGSNGIYTDDDAVIDLTGVALRYNVDGIEARSTTGTPFVNAHDCRITDNTGYGIYLYNSIYYPYPKVTINRSEIHSNGGSNDYYTSGIGVTGVLDARENWWGSADPAVFGSRITDHRRNTGWASIDWCRYLDGPGGDPVVDAHCPDLAVCGETVTLDLTDKPYQVTSDLYVCDTGTLEIGPGVNVLAAAAEPPTDIQVHGVLNVNGTEEDPVTFGSDAADPQPQDWTGLYLASSSVSSVDWAEVNHALNGIEVTGSATATLHGVTARFNRDGWTVGGWGPPSSSATDCTFTDNTRYGVRGWEYTGRPNPTLTMNDSSIHSNGPDDDFYFYPAARAAETVIDARDNWWGTTDPAVIGPRIYDHRTRDGAPIVDWCGYLDGDGGAPARDVHCPDLAPCDETVILDQTDRPYLLTSDLIVCDSGVLQIEPGVEVRMIRTIPAADFRVEGALETHGTDAEPVLLTTDAEPPSVGDWYGVVLRGSSVSTIEGAEITWADHGIEVTGNASAALLEVDLSRNYDGLWVQGYGAQTVTAAGCSFTDNDRFGIFARRIVGFPNPDLSVTRSSLHSNLGSYDLYTIDYANPATSIVWATDNWWGTTDEAEIEARICDYEDSVYAPHVHHQAFGEECDMALGRDVDLDGWPDFDDNCPDLWNAMQQDSDADGMGDPCDPEPATPPSGACDGFEDPLDGYADADGDGWGDPCDFHPLRDDSYPGAPELCDGRDNDGDGMLGAGERTDEDLDLGLLCGDCDDLEPLAHVCLCEECGNVIDDDCDLLADGADPDCMSYPTCIVLEPGADPWLSMHKGDCGGATVSGPFDVIRGRLDQLQFAGGQVDLGQDECVEGNLAWDRVTDLSINLNPRCEQVPVRFYLGKESAAWDYGAASTGEPRDLTDPDPVCP